MSECVRGNSIRIRIENSVDLATTQCSTSAAKKQIGTVSIWTVLQVLLDGLDYFTPNEHNPHFITLAMLHSNFPGSQIYIAQAQGQCFADPEAGIGRHCNNSVIPTRGIP